MIKRIIKGIKSLYRGNGSIRVYFDNCPMGFQSSEVDTMPISKMREYVRIMEIMNDVEEL